jgi:hypothetical protein
MQKEPMPMTAEVAYARVVPSEAYGTDDVYEAAYIAIKTGIEPKAVPVSKRMLEFQFAPSPAVDQAVRDYHDGGKVEARRLSRAVRRNYEIIRSYDWGAGR